METKIDFNAATNFIFEDKEWINKIVIAGFLSLTIIGAIPVMGWALEIQRRVIKEEENPLPDWSNLGDYTINGLKFALVNIIYTLPFILLVSLPFMAITFNLALSDDPSNVEGFLMFVYCISMPVTLVFTIFYYAVMPIFSGVLAETNSIQASLNFPRVFKLVKVNFLQLVGVGLLAYIVSYAGSMVGIWLCFIGMFFTIPLTMGIAYHFFGQVYRNALIKLDETPAA